MISPDLKFVLRTVAFGAMALISLSSAHAADADSNEGFGLYLPGHSVDSNPLSADAKAKVLAAFASIDDRRPPIQGFADAEIWRFRFVEGSEFKVEIERRDELPSVKNRPNAIISYILTIPDVPTTELAESLYRTFPKKYVPADRLKAVTREWRLRTQTQSLGSPSNSTTSAINVRPSLVATERGTVPVGFERYIPSVTVDAGELNFEQVKAIFNAFEANERSRALRVESVEESRLKTHVRFRVGPKFKHEQWRTGSLIAPEVTHDIWIPSSMTALGLPASELGRSNPELAELLYRAFPVKTVRRHDRRMVELEYELRMSAFHENRPLKPDPFFRYFPGFTRVVADLPFIAVKVLLQALEEIDSGREPMLEPTRLQAPVQEFTKRGVSTALVFGVENSSVGRSSLSPHRLEDRRFFDLPEWILEGRPTDQQFAELKSQLLSSLPPKYVAGYDIPSVTEEWKQRTRVNAGLTARPTVIESAKDYALRFRSLFTERRSVYAGRCERLF